MTLQHLLDSIYAVFPSVGEAEAERLLNNALDEFCVTTRVVKGTVEITADGSESYALPSTVFQVQTVFVGTQEYKRAVGPKERWRGSYIYSIFGGNLTVGSYSNNSNLNPVWTPLASGTIEMRCILRAADVTAYQLLLDSSGEAVIDSAGNQIYVEGDSLTGEPGIPAEFHDGLISRVLQRLYERDPDRLSAAAYHERQWNTALIKGIKYNNQTQYGGPVRPVRRAL